MKRTAIKEWYTQERTELLSIIRNDVQDIYDAFNMENARELRICMEVDSEMKYKAEFFLIVRYQDFEVAYICFLVAIVISKPNCDWYFRPCTSRIHDFYIHPVNDRMIFLELPYVYIKKI